MYCLAIVCAIALQVVSADEDFYKAAVVEFSIEQNSDNRVVNNLKGIQTIIETMQTVYDGEVDIVVLPEYAITGYSFTDRDEIAPFLEQIPNIQVNPCDNENFMNDSYRIFRSLSCIAKENSIVIVANMGDKLPCSAMDENCPANGQYQLNTNVVFEKNGDFIAKYHKQHLFAIENNFFDEGCSDLCTTFTTSFGVEFGTLTCFDILYNNPTNCLLSNGIKNFVFPTAWGNSFPLYMSVSFQQGWSLKHKVNILAANQHDPTNRGAGSGIYSSGVAVQYVLDGSSWETSTGHYYVWNLPKHLSVNPFHTQTGHFSEINKIEAGSIKYAQFTKLAALNGAVSQSYNSHTMGKITCELEYSRANQNEIYALAAYIGTSPKDKKFGYSFCAVVKCSADDKCGYLRGNYMVETEFTTLKLSGDFPTGTVYATTLGDKLQLLNPENMETGPNSLSVKDMKVLSASLWTRNEINSKTGHAYCEEDSCS